MRKSFLALKLTISLVYFSIGYSNLLLAAILISPELLDESKDEAVSQNDNDIEDTEEISKIDDDLAALNLEDRSFEVADLIPPIPQIEENDKYLHKTHEKTDKYRRFLNEKNKSERLY